MRAARKFLKRRAHLVAGRTELIGFRKLQTTDKASREGYADYEGEEAADRYAEQEPTLRAPPEPRTYTPACRGGVHFEPLDAVMINPSSPPVGAISRSIENPTRLS
jgi:hypothetical protein